MVLKTGSLKSDYSVVYGKTVEQREAGVVFDPDRQSPVMDIPAKYYPFEALLAYIDTDGKVIYGNIPPALQNNWTIMMNLFPTDRVSHRPIALEMVPGDRFGFCVPPGHYEVVEIMFKNDHGNIDRAVSFGKIRLQVLSGKANYVGDLYLDEVARSEAIRISLPVIPEKRDSDNLFGTTGSLGQAYMEGFRSAKNPKGQHTLDLFYEHGFVSAVELPVTTSRWRLILSNVRERIQDP